MTTLFDWQQDPPPPAQRHSETSREAGEVVEARSARLRTQVHAYLTLCGREGATDEEIQDGLFMNPSTQRPRRVELVQAGLVGDSGLTRPTRSGRKAVVWVVVSE